jgi:hypothetical protein
LLPGTRALFRWRCAACNFFGVTDEPAFRGDQFAASLPSPTGGAADRPTTGTLEVVNVGVLGHAEVYEEDTNRVGPDEQITGEAFYLRIVKRRPMLGGIHRENFCELPRQLKRFFEIAPVPII